MNIEEIRKLANSLPGVTEDIKWGHDLCFLVLEKMFLVLGPDQVPISASFKTSDELFDELSSRPGFIPAPYMARNKWVQVTDISTLGEQEWQEHIRRSYELVTAKFSQKARAGLGLA